MVDVALGDSGVLQRGREGLAGQGHVEFLAEALLPDVGVRLAGDPPAVEELVTRCATAHQFGHGAVGGADEGHRTVPAVTLFGRARQAGAQVGENGQGGAAASRAPRRRPAPAAASPPPSADDPTKS